MGRIVVCGAGLVGLGAALMLAQDGHEVTVLESDADGAPAEPAEAWETWRRKGVAQFRQPHDLLARFRQVCDTELPGMTQRMLDAGCVWVDYLATPPPSITDTAPRPGDEQLRLVTGRRPVVEQVFARAAEDAPGVRVRRGVRVTQLLPGAEAIRGTPHVAGVVTEDGQRITADLVVDATGRRSRIRQWLAELGAHPPIVRSADCGFVYYTRYFTGPQRPRGGRGLQQLGSISLLTLDSDHDTWSVTVFGRSNDRALTALRDTDRFDKVVRACPFHAHWLDGAPLGGVQPLAGVLDRHHVFAVDGRPLVTGLCAVGDSWACTNPSAGRGLSVGMLHAQLLRHVVRSHLAEPAVLAHTWHERTEAELAPFVHNQFAADRARLAAMAAAADGTTPPPPDSPMARLAAAAWVDADALRGLIETVLCMQLPQDVLARPAIQRALAATAGMVVPPLPGPDRAALESLLA